MNANGSEKRVGTIGPRLTIGEFMLTPGASDAGGLPGVLQFIDPEYKPGDIATSPVDVDRIDVTSQ